MVTVSNVDMSTDVTADKTLLPSNVYVSDELRRVCQWVLFAVLCQVVDVCGTVANVINIICFVKLGFKDSINISLLGLAVSDLGCLVTLLFTDICFNPAFQESDLPFDPVELQYLTATWPHVVFSRVTSCITAFITFERCLCVLVPLKVKRFITPGRVKVIIIIIFVFLICSVAPVYYANRLAWKFSSQRNKTILGLVFTWDREKVDQICFIVNNLFIQTSSFGIIIVCTSILVFNLRSKTKWREQSTTTGQAQLISNRDQKVTRMVMVVSIMFIVCFLPVCALITAILIDPGLSIDGINLNTGIVFVGIGLLLESINSSANIFFYYHMSSKYRTVFRHLFRLRPQNDPK